MGGAARTGKFADEGRSPWPRQGQRRQKGSGGKGRSGMGSGGKIRGGKGHGSKGRGKGV